MENIKSQWNLDAGLRGSEREPNGSTVDNDDLLPDDTTPLEIDESLLALVDVTSERLSGRQRQITAQIQIPRAIEQVWQILTDYDQLDEFIPNLSKSCRLPSPEGITLIEQIGAQCWLNLKFCARVVLQMEEAFPNEIRFRMVEGDFKGFEGFWRLAPIELEGQPGTALAYNVLVMPRLTMPIGLVERHLRRNLAVNLVAIQQRAIAMFGP